jgi:hypothetical protein
MISRSYTTLSREGNGGSGGRDGGVSTPRDLGVFLASVPDGLFAVPYCDRLAAVRTLTRKVIPLE